MRGHLRGCWSGQVAPGGPKSSPGAAELGDGVGKSGVFPCEHSRRGAVPRSRSSAFQSHSCSSRVSPPSRSPPLLLKSINPAGDQSLALGPGRSLPGAIPDPGAGCGSGTARAQSCSNPWNRGRKGPSPRVSTWEDLFYLFPLREFWGGIPPGILVRDPSRVLWDTLGCCGMPQDALGCFRVSQGCCRIPRNALACPWNAEGYPGMLRMPRDPSGMLRNSHPPIPPGSIPGWEQPHSRPLHPGPGPGWAGLCWNSVGSPGERGGCSTRSRIPH